MRLEAVIIGVERPPIGGENTAAGMGLVGGVNKGQLGWVSRYGRPSSLGEKNVAIKSAIN